MPNVTLVKYIENRLEVERLQRKAIEEDRSLSEAERKRVRNSDRMKVHILDEHIFRSMANLIFFLETMSTKSELHDDFREALEDLSGTKISFPDRKSLYPTFDEWSNKITNTPFERLISAFVDARSTEIDFKLELTFLMQVAIYDKIVNTVHKRYGEDLMFLMIKEDLRRAVGVLTLMAKTHQRRSIKPSRTIDFPAPYRHSKEYRDIFPKLASDANEGENNKEERKT